MFITRTISGIILLVIMLSTMILGGPVWLLITGVLSFIALFELFRIFQLQTTYLAYFGYLCNAVLYGMLYFGFASLSNAIVVTYLIFIMAIYVILWPRYEIGQISKVMLSFLYAGICMSYFYQIRVLDQGLYFMWLVFISAWGSDTCAYLTGILIGKHKLPSSLSPKKTIEGCIGGIVGAIILGMCYGLWVDKNLNTSLSCAVLFACTCGVGSIVSQIGDLAASAIKRNADIKDYGKLIPGHGGIMDRFDSILFISPIIYYIIYCLTQVSGNNIFR